MADVTISQLTQGTPNGNNLFPYSTGNTTLGVTVSSIFENTNNVAIGSVALKDKGNLQIRNGAGNAGDLLVGNMSRVGGNINQGFVDFNSYYDPTISSTKALASKFAGIVSFNANDGIMDFRVTSNQQTADSAITNLFSRMAIDSQGRVTMPFQPAFHVWNQSAQSLGGGAVMLFNATSTNSSRVFNQGNYYANNKFIAPVTGVYQFSVNVIMNSSTGGSYWGVGLVLNGTDTIDFSYAAGGSLQQSLNVSSTIKLAANDYIDVRASTNGVMNMDNSGTFSGHLVG